jgi:hypothetical protein
VSPEGPLTVEEAYAGYPLPDLYIERLGVSNNETIDVPVGCLATEVDDCQDFIVLRNQGPQPVHLSAYTLVRDDSVQMSDDLDGHGWLEAGECGVLVASAEAAPQPLRLTFDLNREWGTIRLLQDDLDGSWTATHLTLEEDCHNVLDDPPGCDRRGCAVLLRRDMGT